MGAWGVDTQSPGMRSELSRCQERPGLAPHGEHGGLRDEDSAQDSMKERRRQGQGNPRDGRCMGLSSQLSDGREGVRREELVQRHMLW